MKQFSLEFSFDVGVRSRSFVLQRRRFDLECFGRSISEEFQQLFHSVRCSLRPTIRIKARVLGFEREWLLHSASTAKGH